MSTSFQGVLEDAVSNLSEEDSKNILMEIATSLSGSGEDKERCHDIISEIINRIIA
ncbi:hypothetical protein [Psychrobacillus sp. FSL H8-0510]|uniref:hypothetical protein n=1 Tax=Psychrobacillus sp. FSL H8-0510 TaxID=2921394 RepID=UPI0030F783BF